MLIQKTTHHKHNNTHWFKDWKLDVKVQFAENSVLKLEKNKKSNSFSSSWKSIYY